MKDFWTKVAAGVVTAAIVAGAGALWRINDKIATTSERIARIEAVLSIKNQTAKIP